MHSRRTLRIGARGFAQGHAFAIHNEPQLKTANLSLHARDLASIICRSLGGLPVSVTPGFKSYYAHSAQMRSPRISYSAMLICTFSLFFLLLLHSSSTVVLV